MARREVSSRRKVHNSKGIAKFCRISLLAFSYTGPLPNTLPHFLQMILENDVKLVIMLTSTRQKNETTGKVGQKLTYDSFLQQHLLLVIFQV